MKAFDDIADEWDEYRRAPATVMKLFLPLIPKGAAVLDAGCGNGRNLIPIAQKAKFAWGIDTSQKMLEYCAKNVAEGKLGKKTRLLKASVLKIPLADDSLDAVVCISVLHHLRTESARFRALKEFGRVLRPGGLFLISVWNERQRRFEGKVGEGAKGRNRTVKWKRRDGIVVRRFHHFFGENELAGLIRRAGLGVEKTFFEKGGARMAEQGAKNLCAIAVKGA
ncbi:class I SAM-dependent methyltransferase [Candidatus Micrarchaeota archaeon]|nr:class I SAM-dependent methyltransferase [Candidatus Micrarchaeota archaeon]